MSKREWEKRESCHFSVAAYLFFGWEGEGCINDTSHTTNFTQRKFQTFFPVLPLIRHVPKPPKTDGASKRKKVIMEITGCQAPCVVGVDPLLHPPGIYNWKPGSITGNLDEKNSQKLTNHFCCDPENKATKTPMKGR